MKMKALLLLLVAPMFALAGTFYDCADGECQRTGVSEMPNPSFHNPLIGQGEVTNSGTTTYYTTTGDKSVRVGPGVLKRLYTASGTSITVTAFDDADSTCNTGQVSGVIPLTNGLPVELGFEFANGICLTVAGTSPTLTVVTAP